jgi:tetratricopeptide (TPR) repeat protein
MDERANRETVDEVAANDYLATIAGRTDLTARGERVGLLRMLGRLDEAAREGEAALALARQEGTARQRVTALLRLAHVRQWRREWESADELFAEALRQAQELADPLMVAFAHQHSGRNHVDQGRHAEAVESFRAALALREAHDAPTDQLESTRGALRAAEARLAEAKPAM